MAVVSEEEVVRSYDKDEERKTFASMTPSQQQEFIKKNAFLLNERLKNKK